MSKDGFVYLIKGIRGLDTTYKIGTSKKPEIRIKSVQTGNPDELIILFKVKSNMPYKLETYLHRTFTPFSIRGEWFNSDIIENKFEDECKKFKNMVDLLMNNSTLTEKQLTKII